MTVASRIGNSFPTGGSTSADALRQNLALGLANVIEGADDIQDIDYSTMGRDALPDVIIVRETLIAYRRIPSDFTSEHDGVAILVSADNKVFKSALQPSAFVNVLNVVSASTGNEFAGDRYIVDVAPSGDFAAFANKLVYKDGAGDWVPVTATIGQVVYVRAAGGHYHWSEAGIWKPGIGQTTIAEGQVGARELAFPWGMAVEAEIATPPGTRATGATPTMPLGGTAANINDDTTGTVGTTSALGNLSAAATAARVFARLDLGTDYDLAAIEAKQLRASTGSSSTNSMGFYYATAAAPTTLVQLGSGFTLTATPTDFVRSGTFTARYIFVVTQAKDWSTATHILSDLNAYKVGTSISDGTKYLVGANGIGAFSGRDNEIAEAWGGTYRFYDPYDGAMLLLRSDKNIIRFDEDTGAWISAGGAWVDQAFVRTPGTSVGTANTGSQYTFNESTPPPQTYQGRIDTVGIAFAAKSAGRKLKLTYQAEILFSTAASQPQLTIGVVRDADVNAVAWHSLRGPESAGTYRKNINYTFLFEAIDDALHTYKIKVFHPNDNDGTSSFSDRLLEIQESA